MKYDDCDKYLTQKHQQLNYVEVMKVYTTATYSILSSSFIVDVAGRRGEILGNHFGSVWILSCINFVNWGTTFENFTLKQGG